MSIRIEHLLENRRAYAAAACLLMVTIAGGVVLWLATRHASHTAAIQGSGASDRVVFTDETFSRGVVAEQRQGDNHLTGLDETLGSGACALDYDNDGWIDLFIVNGSGDTRYYGRRNWWQSAGGHKLFKNVGGGHFTDVSATAFVPHPMRGFGCVAADFDNDGNTDLLITGSDESLLLRNLGNGRFVDVTEKAGLKGHGWQTVAAVADVDGDGLLDIYVGRFIEYQKGARTFEPGSQYKQDVSGSFNSTLYPAQGNSLYRNLGGFRFEDVTDRAGVRDPDGRTLGALWVDIDDDQRPDLIVVNAAGTGSTTMFHNDGKWRFTALGSETRLQTAAGSRAPTLADVDNDGVPEIVVTATNGAQSAIFFRENPSSSRPIYRDRARPWGFARDDYSAYSPWSAVAEDFNNDGWLDLFVGNGLIIPDPDVPRLTVGQPKQLWLNSRDGALRPQAASAMDPLADRQSSRGIVAADFDNDGDVDLYVAHNNDLGQLLINQSPRSAHWIGLRLVDSVGNRSAIGARVELESAAGSQYRWITSGMGFLSGSDPRVHFGLGSSAAIDRIVVTWPDGRKSKYRDLPVDRYVTLVRDKQPLIQQPATPPETHYASLARAPEPELRADYIRLLVDSQGMDAALGELRDSLRDRDPAVRSATVEILSAHQSATSLSVLLDVLSDNDSRVVLAAAKAVCPYEEEAAARWLLRLFKHADPAVRAAAADCFGRYFYREQAGALLHRKYLSLAYLVQALADKDEGVQIAAARALGNAERFRGVPPLLELAAGTPNAAVRAEAIRAVGLIRDKQGMPGLLAILKNRKLQQEPTTLAQLFVALKRLDYAGLPAAMGDLAGARGDFAGLAIRTRLGAMRELLRADDGVVIARSDIAAMAYRARGDLPQSGTKDEATTLALIEVLRESSSPASIPELAAMAEHGRTAVIKAGCLKALSTIDPLRVAKYLEQGLQEQDAEVGRRLLQALEGTHVDLSDSVLRAALSRADTRTGVIRIVLHVHSVAAADVISNFVVDPNAAPQIRAAALDALTRSRLKVKLPEELYSTRENALAHAVVAYEVGQLPALYVSRVAPPSVERLLRTRSSAVRWATIDALAQRQEFWAKASILSVLKSREDVTVREHVLELIAQNALEGSGLLEMIATDKSDPLRLDALRHLEGRQGSSAELLLLNVLRDVSEDPHARIIAAHRLVGHLGPEVLRLLERAT